MKPIRCAIDGCEGQTRIPGPAGAVWICSKHWRTACPPGSKERKAYNRIFRLKRKYGGWNRDLSNRFWIIWHGIVRRGNARVRGDVDKAAIDKLFGWSE